MIKRKIALFISAVLILTSIGCSKKPKDESALNTGKPESTDKITEGDKEKEEEKKEESEKPKEEEVAKEENKDKAPSNDNETIKKPENNNKPTVKPEPPKPTNPGTGGDTKPEVKPEEPKPEEPKPDNPGNEPTNPEAPSIDLKDMATKILKEGEYSMVGQMPEELSKEYYPFDRSLVSEYAIHHAMINVRSDELAIFKVKDVSSFGEIEKGIQKRLEILNRIWGQYLPDQHEKVKNYIIVKKDNYIMFAISNNQDKVKEAFNSFFTK